MYDLQTYMSKKHVTYRLKDEVIHRGAPLLKMDTLIVKSCECPACMPWPRGFPQPADLN